MSKSSEFHIYATDIVAWAHKKVLNICQDQQRYVHNSILTQKQLHTHTDMIINKASHRIASFLLFMK